MFNFVEGYAVHVSRFFFVEGFAVLGLTGLQSYGLADSQTGLLLDN